MKVFFSPSSPFVRKVLVCARELGLGDRVERLACAANPINRDQTIIEHNPLGQVPTLLTDDGRVLFDSRVISEYLDSLGGGRLFGSGEARWQALTEQSLGDGLMNAALLTRFEKALRPEPLFWEAWSTAQFDKVHSALSKIESWAADFEGRVDIGTITIACGLSYLDFRFSDFDWRSSHPKTAVWYAEFEQRPSMVETALRS
jgi:glutathione S-transferase